MREKRVRNLREKQMSEDNRRDSKALEPELIADPEKKAEAEARNGLRQYDAGINSIQTALDRGSFKLRPSLILALHREALAGISSYAVTIVRQASKSKVANINHRTLIWCRNWLKIYATT